MSKKKRSVWIKLLGAIVAFALIALIIGFFVPFLVGTILNVPPIIGMIIVNLPYILGIIGAIIVFIKL